MPDPEAPMMATISPSAMVRVRSPLPRGVRRDATRATGLTLGSLGTGTRVSRPCRAGGDGCCLGA